MSLPSSFSYFADRMSGGVVRNNIKVIPKGSTTVKNNQSMEVELPSDSILDLTTLTMRAKFIYQNAVGGTNGVRAVPQAHTLFRNVSFALNNQTISGNNTGQQWGRVYELLRRCSSSTDKERSNSDNYARVPMAIGGVLQGSELATDSVGQNITFSDWCSICHSPNAENFDTAIFGNLKLRLDLESDQICYGYADSGSNDYAWQLENVEFTCDAITFVGAENMYDNIMAEMLGSGASLLMPYPEWYAQLSQNSGTIKFNISVSSLDVIGFCALPTEALSATQLTSSGGTVAAANVEYGPAFTQYKLQNTSNALPDENSENEKYFFNVNQRVIPQYGAEPVGRGVQHTKATFSHDNCLSDYNLLFKGNMVDDGSDTLGSGFTHNRRNNLRYNTIVAHKLCLDSPAHQNEKRLLSGMNTQGQSSTISLSLTNVSASDNTIIFGLSSAVLQASLGQSISVIY